MIDLRNTDYLAHTHAFDVHCLPFLILPPHSYAFRSTQKVFFRSFVPTVLLEGGRLTRRSHLDDVLDHGCECTECESNELYT